MRSPGTAQPLLPATPPRTRSTLNRAGAFSQSFTFSSSPYGSFLLLFASFELLEVIPERGQVVLEETSCGEQACQSLIWFIPITLMVSSQDKRFAVSLAHQQPMALGLAGLSKPGAADKFSMWVFFLPALRTPLLSAHCPPQHRVPPPRSSQPHVQPPQVPVPTWAPGGDVSPSTDPFPHLSQGPCRERRLGAQFASHQNRSPQTHLTASISTPAKQPALPPPHKPGPQGLKWPVLGELVSQGVVLSRRTRVWRKGRTWVNTTPTGWGCGTQGCSIHSHTLDTPPFPSMYPPNSF